MSRLMVLVLVLLAGCGNSSSTANTSRPPQTTVEPPRIAAISPKVVANDAIDPRTGERQQVCIEGVAFRTGDRVFVRDVADGGVPVLVNVVNIDERKITFELPVLRDLRPRAVEIEVIGAGGTDKSALLVGPPNSASVQAATSPAPIYPGQSGVPYEALIFNTTGKPIVVTDGRLEFDDPGLRGFLTRAPATVPAFDCGAVEFQLAATDGVSDESSSNVSATFDVLIDGVPATASGAFDVETGAAPLLSARGRNGADGGAIIMRASGSTPETELAIQVGGTPPALAPLPDAPGGITPATFDVDQEPVRTGSIVLSNLLNGGGFVNDPDQLRINAAGPILSSGDRLSFPPVTPTGVVEFEGFSLPALSERLGEINDVLIVKTGSNAGTYRIVSLSFGASLLARVTNLDGSPVSFDTTAAPADWCVKRRVAELEPFHDAEDDPGMLAASCFTTSLADVNFGGLRDGDAITSGDVGDLLILGHNGIVTPAEVKARFGAGEKVLVITEVVSAGEVKVIDPETGRPLPDDTLLGDLDWRTDHSVPIRIGGDLTLDRAVISVAPEVGPAHLRIVADGDITVLDSRIVLEQRRPGTFSDSTLILDAAGSVTIGSSILATGPDAQVTNAAGGAIVIHAGESVALGDSTPQTPNLLDASSDPAGNGGRVTIVAERGVVSLGANTVLIATGGNNGGSVRVDSKGDRTDSLATIRVDGGLSGIAGSDAGTIEIEGETIVVASPEGDTVLNVNGGSGVNGGAAGGIFLTAPDGSVRIGTSASGRRTACLAVGGHGDRVAGVGGSITVLGPNGNNQRFVEVIALFDASGGGVTDPLPAPGARSGDAGGDVGTISEIDVPDPADGNVATTTDPVHGFDQGPAAFAIKIVDNPLAPTTREFAFVTARDGSTALLPARYRAQGNTSTLAGPGLFGVILGGIHILADAPITVHEDAVLRVQGGSPVLSGSQIDAKNTEIAGGDGGTVRLYSDQDGVGGDDDPNFGPLTVSGLILAKGGYSVNAPAGNARRGTFTLVQMAAELAGEGVLLDGFVDARGGCDLRGSAAGNGGVVVLRGYVSAEDAMDLNLDGVIDIRDGPATPESGTIVEVSAGKDQPGAFGGSVFVALESQGNPNGGLIDLSSGIRALGEGATVQLATFGLGFRTTFFPTAFSNLRPDGATIQVSGDITVSRSGRIALEAEGDNATILFGGSLQSVSGPIVVRLDQDDNDLNGTIGLSGTISTTGSNADSPVAFVSVLNRSDGGTTEVGGTIRIFDRVTGNGGSFDLFADARTTLSGLLDASGRTDSDAGGRISVESGTLVLESGTTLAADEVTYDVRDAEIDDRGAIYLPDVSIVTVIEK